MTGATLKQARTTSPSTSSSLRLTTRGCSTPNSAFSRLPLGPDRFLLHPAVGGYTMTSMVYTVRWEKNGSKYYDGRTQDVPEEAVLESDRARGVGDSVRVEWGNRLWNAVVLEKQPLLAPPYLIND